MNPVALGIKTEKDKIYQSHHSRKFPERTLSTAKAPFNNTIVMPPINSGHTDAKSRENRQERGEYRILCVDGYNQGKHLPHPESLWQD